VTTNEATGSIYDLGYQGYDGPRLGRGAVAVALLRQTLSAAYGIGRGGRAKIVPFGLAALALLPAVLAVGIGALIRQAGAPSDAIEEASPIRHDSYQGLTATLVVLFCAAQAPELFGRDQRYGVLPLFFSRSIGREDYAIARLGGLAIAIFALMASPHVVLLLGAMFAASDPISGLIDELGEIPRWLVICTIAAGVYGGVSAVISAWTPRRAYAAAAIIAVFVVPQIVALIAAELAASDLARLLILASPPDLVDGANAALFGVISDSPAVAASGIPAPVFVGTAVVVAAGSAALVVRRYLRITV
jgi:ABC-2 type transport system permease protein